MMPLSVVVVPPTTPIRSGLLLPDRIAGSDTARATAISRIAVVIRKTRVLARSRISLRATSQVRCSGRLGRATLPWFLVSVPVLSVLIALLPS